MKQWFLVFCMLVLVPGTCPAFQPVLWGLALDGYPIDETRLQAVTAQTGIPPGLVVFFMQWPKTPDTGHFPEETLNNIWSFGAVPCLTWEPMFIENGQEKTIDHDAITSGQYDRYLTAFARSAKTWGRPLIIRFAHEMNTRRYHWGTSETAYGPESPRFYQDMFRYLVNLFRKEGAGNVLWAFCPNAESIPNRTMTPDAAWNTATAYYPGNGFVDILGMDGYNWGTTQTTEKNGWKSDWRSFESIFGAMHAELKAISSTKPVIVFETASTVQGGDKARWITDALDTVDTWGVTGLAWFEVNKELDWRLSIGLPSEAIVSLRSRLSPAHAWARSLVRNTGR